MHDLGLVIVLFLGLFITGYGVDYCCSNTFGRIYRIFIAPGVIYHELAHALACLVCGAKVKKVAVFEKSGGYVLHSKPKVPIIGQMLISFAPFFATFIGIYYLSHLFINYELKTDSIYNTIAGITTGLHTILKEPKLVVIYLYLLLNLVSVSRPSTKDLENALSSLFVLGAVFLASLYFHFYSNLTEPFLQSVVPYMEIALSFSLLTLLIIFPFYLVRRVV